KESNAVRGHMPGHKGIKSPLGVEDLDITEIDGADELYAAEGIIAESEKNAGSLFGATTFYSAEGSSLSIRAMVLLTLKWAKINGKRPFILAGRNAHKTFINVVTLLGIKVEWLFGRPEDSYEMCRISPEDIEKELAALKEKSLLPAAVYITSPDYLGNMPDIKGIAEVCHRFKILLLVDNAHGAYLKFLNPSLHPMDLGADMCADSAHKTLPALTGTAYLHISGKAPSFFRENAREAMEFFGSTSPSYLFLASLDLLNPYLEILSKELERFVPSVLRLKERLKGAGYKLVGQEPLKITINAAASGFSGDMLKNEIKKEGIICEYHDENYLVLMLTPQNSDADLVRIEEALAGAYKRLKEGIEKGNTIPKAKGLVNNVVTQPEVACSPMEAFLSESEELPAEKCIGRVMASAAVSCPPAVPVYMYGEKIDKAVFPGRKLKVIKEKF
ncbi:MAG: aminotransferase class V-fold PLP-dependent enzyme, partial [Lachnospiraceae bacterium]|nr:aminotransferase class V-fold PLP-dependent enzyme [Lachnospiraceae bacterium]